jgi:hypothetical protein
MSARLTRRRPSSRITLSAATRTLAVERPKQTLTVPRAMGERMYVE